MEKLRPFRPSRRHFLGGAAALGLVGTSATRSLAETPRRGGRLAIALQDGSANDTLDPRTFTSITAATCGLSFGNCLTEIGQDFQLTPELATSWEPDKTASSWVFNIRQGVTFHNGKTLTAVDVLWSLNLHRGENSTSGAKPLLSQVVDIKADGPGRVIIELNRGNLDLPYLLSDFHFVIVPVDTIDFSKGIGTGAYKVTDFDPGVRLSGKRNGDYWKPDRGLVDEITLLAVADATARANGLISGELQLANRLDSRTARLFKTSPGVQVFDSPSGGFRPINMLCDMSPFDSNDVRLAVKYAIDRKDILEKTVSSFGIIANDHPIPPFDPMFSHEIPQREQDLDKARFHWKKAGYSGPALVLNASTATHAEAIDMALLVREQMDAAGIPVTVNRRPADGYWDNVWMKEPLSIAAWGARPTADIMLSTAFKSDAAWNDSHWRSKDFDAILEAARGEADFGKRKEMYHDLQLMIHETGGSAITYFANNIDGASDKVRGYIPGGYDLSGMRAPERCWLAE